MPSSKLAEAYVEIGTQDRTGQGLGAVRAKLDAFVGEWGPRLMLPVGIAAAAGLAAAVRVLSDATMKAVDLQETMSKVAEVFKTSTPLVTKFADEMAEKYGLVKRTTLDAAASLGLVAQAAGLSKQQSAELAVQMATLAADASSFYNIPLDQALEKFRSGLVGEAEPMRALGVLLDEASVKTKALAMGLNGDSQGGKVRARAALIMEGLKTASGDLERTIDSPANALRKLQGDWENFLTNLGEHFKGSLVSILKLVEDIGKGLGEIFTDDRVKAFAENLNAIVNLARAAMGEGAKPDKRTGTEKTMDTVANLFGIPANLFGRGKPADDAIKDRMDRFLNKGADKPIVVPDHAESLREAAKADARAMAAAAPGLFGGVMAGLQNVLGVGKGAADPLLAEAQRRVANFIGPDSQKRDAQSFSDLTAAGRSMQMDILNMDDTPKQQLNALNQIKDGTVETVKHMEALITMGTQFLTRGAQAKLGAVLKGKS